MSRPLHLRLVLETVKVDCRRKHIPPFPATAKFKAKRERCPEKKSHPPCNHAGLGPCLSKPGQERAKNHRHRTRNSGRGARTPSIRGAAFTVKDGVQVKANFANKNWEKGRSRLPYRTSTFQAARCSWTCGRSADALAACQTINKQSRCRPKKNNQKPARAAARTMIDSTPEPPLSPEHTPTPPSSKHSILRINTPGREGSLCTS